ncbi:MAG: phenylalanine--tRNA ligase subunit beta [Gemmatimonadaceae bacterium]
MNASYEWLRAFVPLDATPAQLRDLLTAHTATVEELVALRADLAPIVVARVVEARRHPESDHLWATRVDAGGADLLDVICGAPNVSEGKLYPFAPVGTTMPNGMTIERRKIRGIASNGMLCSARELGLGENHDGILELDVAADPGTPLLQAMPVGDTRLVVDVGANRPDLLSHLGIARELAAIRGTPWTLPEIAELGPDIPPATSARDKGSTAGITITVAADTATRRYVCAVVTGVQIGSSPDWLVRRLAAVGIRPINNVVDATNYVLHELGQPVHAFDLRKLAGGAVTVRLARPGEKLVTLDGAERALPVGTVVIADATKAQAVAGVMGGRDSEVSSDTRDLFIEVASFDPKRTRAARRSIGLSTDASYRFERGVDPQLAPLAMERVVRLIIGLAGGSLADAAVDLCAPQPPPRELLLRAARVSQVLGADVPMAQARAHLEGAGFGILSASATELRVRVPTWRTDIFSEVDLVEEVARFQGYDNFPTEIRPFRPTTTVDDPQWTTANRVREAAVALGLLETRPLPFVRGVDATHVRVANPLSENEAFLRTSLLETLTRRAEFNLAQRTGDVRLFEIGSAFAPAGGGMPSEEFRLGVLIMGRRRPAHFTEPQPPVVDEWDAKGIAEATTRAAYPDATIELLPSSGEALWDILVAGDTVGSVRRVALDAPVWAAPAFGLELRLGVVSTAPPAERGRHAYAEARRLPRPAVTKYRALPATPVAEFDLALLVPVGTSVGEVERVVRGVAGELLERLELFDQYTGAGVEAGHRSLAWRLTFRHPERTLRDKEIEGRRSKILGALQQELHVRQRTT